MDDDETHILSARFLDSSPNTNANTNANIRQDVLETLELGAIREDIVGLRGKGLSLEELKVRLDTTQPLLLFCLNKRLIPPARLNHTRTHTHSA